MPDAIQLLFFSANPLGTGKLALDEEARQIEIKVRAAEYREALILSTKWATRADDLLQFLNQMRPEIVHFSGHGSPKEEILLVGSDGKAKPVSKAALSALFRTLKDNIRLVVLNACFSRPQAEAIVQHIDCAVGMKKAIGDPAAITFAASFYRAIGFGRSIQEAFDQGVTALLLEGIPEQDTPELLLREGVDASKIFLIQRKAPERKGSPGEKGSGSSSAVPSPSTTSSTSNPRALKIWRDKLAYLQEEEAKTTDAAQKFSLKQQIEECRQKIREYGGEA